MPNIVVLDSWMEGDQLKGRAIVDDVEIVCTLGIVGQADRYGVIWTLEALRSFCEKLKQSRGVKLNDSQEIN